MSFLVDVILPINTKTLAATVYKVIKHHWTLVVINYLNSNVMISELHENDVSCWGFPCLKR